MASSVAFVSKISELFCGRFDVSDVCYVNNRTPIKISCLLCRYVWFPIPSNLLKGTGCPKCANVLKHNITSFTRKAVELHGEKFNYSRVKYVNNRTLIDITCQICDHDFRVMPRNHLSGKGCPKCANNQLLTANNVTHMCSSRADADYNKMTINGSRLSGIVCTNCGHCYEQGRYAHVTLRCGCPRCSGKERHSKVRFIERSIEIHGIERFDYTMLSDTLTSKKHVTLMCRSCERLIRVTPSNHLVNKSGCPFCCKRVSREESEWLDILNMPDEFRQVRIPNTRRHADALRDNVVYEFYGSFWHGDPRLYKSTDVNKRCNRTFGELFVETAKREKDLIKLGYDLRVMWQNDWRNGCLKSVAAWEMQ